MEKGRKKSKIDSIQLAYDILCVSNILFDNEIRTNFIHFILKFWRVLTNEETNSSDLYQNFYMRGVMGTCSRYILWIRCQSLSMPLLLILATATQNSNTTLCLCISSDWIFSELYSFLLGLMSLLNCDWAASFFLYDLFSALFNKYYKTHAYYSI